MASWPEVNLRCPVCHDIFKEPVLLPCSHSFCKACWQRWWTQKSTHECPVCKRKALLYDAPLNLALKNLCEDFLKVRVQRQSAALCILHSEDLKLFCVDDQKPVCVICLHSSSHTSHSFRPIDEAAMDYREVLRELLKPLQEKLELFNDMKGNLDHSAKDIELQAKDTERQITAEILMLQNLLKKEKKARIDAVMQEKKQKSQVMKWKTEALSREIATLSDTVRATEEVLRAEDLSFLQNYKTSAEIVNCFQLSDPQPIPAGLIDMAKHLNNLLFAVLDSIKKRIPNSLEVLVPKTNPEPPLNLRETSANCNALQSEAASTRPLSVAAAMANLNRTGYKSTTLNSFNPLNIQLRSVAANTLYLHSCSKLKKEKAYSPRRNKNSLL